jgi:Zn-dependent M28 family amino/carboxypeptidase
MDSFSGERAYQDVLAQMEFGPRFPGSPGHQQVQAWIRSELEAAGWLVEEQRVEMMGQTIINLVAKETAELDPEKPWIIIGAHYDTRLHADNDMDVDKMELPVPGANDGASGVAVLTELARSLPREKPNQVWLVFFDAEDNGRIAGWDWIMGSSAFVSALDEKPDAAVIVDMIGDADLNIYYEKNSDPELAGAIWSIAAEAGYGNVFIPEAKYRITDDHIPFIEAGIRAVDIIDFDYPYWHTTQDTADKVSAESLLAVGETLWQWLQIEGLQ